eukprot:Anaeramoba_ignava/a612650_7.p1 GENE.a612650_7~~a612650_7.p1  ORF type:complete len:328 (+),score=80.21 a612650_7:40-1023(+)
MGKAKKIKSKRETNKRKTEKKTKKVNQTSGKKTKDKKQKKRTKFRKMNQRKEKKVHHILYGKINHPLFVFLSFFCLTFIPLILINLRIDNEIRSSWVASFAPLFFVLAHFAIFSFFSFLENYYRRENPFWIDLSNIFASFLLIVFLVIFGLKLDQKSFKDVSLLVVCIPLYLITFLSILFVILEIREEKRMSERESRFILPKVIFYLHFQIYLFSLCISSFILSAKFDFGHESISWKSAFIPLFISSFSPLIIMLVFLIISFVKEEMNDIYKTIQIINFVNFVIALFFLELNGCFQEKWMEFPIKILQLFFYLFIFYMLALHFSCAY